MKKLFRSPRLIRISMIAVAMFTLFAFRGLWHTRPSTGVFPSTVVLPSRLSARLLPYDEAAAGREMRFLQARVKDDPDDMRAQNALAAQYLQRMRETNNVAFLNLATRAARASLASVPAVRNNGGLTALAQAEFAVHDFSEARDHALELTKLNPGTSEAYALLGDALLELGDYATASKAFHQMSSLGEGSTGVETRLGRFALIQGEPEMARQHFLTALALAMDLPLPPRETVAWSHWQLGETAFSIGEYEAAERHYRDALTTFPGYLNAIASLGRVRAARNDLPDAIHQYEQAIRRVPDPVFVAALGDLYHLVGREQESIERYALVEQIGHLAVVNGTRYNRNLVMFHADHDMKVEEAYAAAAEEYAVRRDIYGADALAWSALKAGKAAEAKVMIREALRLGTRDAKLFYHAGMIARANGALSSAREYLKRAVALNPGFDPVQARVARRALQGMGE